jgi:hypothetical protein
VWGSVELADGADHDDVVLQLRCHSHAFHGSYTAASARDLGGFAGALELPRAVDIQAR